MNLQERIESFAQLGKILREALNGTHGSHADHINSLIGNQHILNQWFTPDNVRFALQSIADELTSENLIKWTSAYPGLKNEATPLKAGIIMAGNIPLAGIHDFLSVLISGNNLIAKISSKDPELIICISEILCSLNIDFRKKIEFTEDRLKDFDVIIATGSNNSSRYFDYYFSKYPNIIRKNRNSIAIIEGDESDLELEELGKDIFSYFGLGCRNVSKLYLPEGYDISKMTRWWNHYQVVIHNKKFANNYDFNKAVYLVNREPFIDTGYLLIKEDTRLSSPVSVLFYEFYKSKTAVREQIEIAKDRIQCIVGRDDIPYGKAQFPHLWDFADGIDTIDFLIKKNLAGLL